MAKTLKKVFEAEIGGAKTQLAVVRPTYAEEMRASLSYNKAFREAVDGGALLRAKIEAVMRKQDLWDDAKQARHDQLVKQLRESERDLRAGGIPLKEARLKAVQMTRDRREWQRLRSERTQLDVHTAEGQAEQAKFNFLVALCTVYNADRRPVFKSVEDYMTSEEPYAYQAATEFANLYHDVDADWEKKLPENDFLMKWKFVNDKLQYVDPSGHLTDADGRLVDAEGRYVNTAGEFVDREGNRLDADGNLFVESPKPFLDEAGNPLVPEAIASSCV